MELEFDADGINKTPREAAGDLIWCTLDLIEDQLRNVERGDAILSDDDVDELINHRLDSILGFAGNWHVTFSDYIQQAIDEVYVIRDGNDDQNTVPRLLNHIRAAKEAVGLDRV